MPRFSYFHNSFIANSAKPFLRMIANPAPAVFLLSHAIDERPFLFIKPARHTATKVYCVANLLLLGFFSFKRGKNSTKTGNK